jgi:hypothetical protein
MDSLGGYEIMNQFLFLGKHDLDSGTWIYLSSLITVAIYFKFSRVWSVRNLDILLLIGLAPGFMFIGLEPSGIGYAWLFVAGALILLRLLLDPMMVRRPLLEPNLSAGGLTFMGLALMLFLTTNVVTGGAAAAMADPQTADRASLERGPVSAQASLPAFSWIPGLDLTEKAAEKSAFDDETVVRARRILAGVALGSHLAILLGLLTVGYMHYGNVRMGIAAAALYLLVPYTAHLSKTAPESICHVLPAALLLWAVAAYRRPFTAGLLLGLSTGLAIIPMFMIPLWVSFYWQRGWTRFAVGLLTSLALTITFCSVSSGGLGALGSQILSLFSAEAPGPGFWSQHEPVWRIPILAGYFALAGTLAIWPAQKNLGTLLSCSAAIVLGSQFWLPTGGGLYLAWYLPLFVLTVFRPNLEDRIALTVLGEGWFHRRKQVSTPMEIAA